MTTLNAALIIFVLTISARAADEGALLRAVPSQVQPVTGHVVIKLLEAVCPEHVTSNVSGPGFSDWDGSRPPGSVPPPRSVNGILFGHFLSATSVDVLVSSERGETHADRYGGTLLMTVQAGRWKPLWYRSGLITMRCMRVRAASGREIPVCEDAYIMGGHQTHDLYAIDFLPAGPKEQVLLSTDTFAWPHRAQKETLDSVRVLMKDGHPVLEAKVHYFRSESAADSDLSQVLQRVGEFHAIDFLLKDDTFVVAPDSAAFLESFSAPPN